MSWRAVVLAVGLVLGVPAAASAATAFPIGTGYAPNVAVDAAGTAYIAWNGDELPSKLHFCRLPRGATACAAATTISDTDTVRDSLSRPFLFVSGATVRIAQYRYGGSGEGVFLFTSINNGTAFTAQRKIGTIAFDDALVGPGATISGVTNAVTGGTFFQNAPLDNSTGAASTSANLSPDRPYLGAIGLNGATPVVVYDNGSGLAQVRRYDGTGTMNSATNWTPAVDIGYADYPSLAGGPSGLFMLYGDETNAMNVRRFDGATFGAPASVLGAAEDPQSWLTQDPGGRLHGVIPQGDADGIHLVHATSDNGAAWRSGTLFVQTAGGIADTRAAAAADHLGVAVFWTRTSEGKQIRVVPIGPEAPVDPAPSGGGTTPPPGGGTNTTPKRRKAGLPSAKKPPATAKRLANGDVRVAVKGVIRRPSGVAKALGCRGKVALRFKRGKRAIRSKTIKVNRRCLFRRNLILRRQRVLRARILAMSVRFKGNASVAPAKRTYKLPVKGR